MTRPARSARPSLPAKCRECSTAPVRRKYRGRWVIHCQYHLDLAQERKLRWLRARRG